MSGWIKIERALQTDLRFKKAARKLDLRAIFEAATASPERDVTLRKTLLLGGLAQLWLHADEHIRENDVLRYGVDDVDELVGVENFAQSLPPDWFQVIDADHVQLPDFATHNGTSTRERRLNAERQRRYRERHGSADPRPTVTPGNGNNAPRPDQTRPEKGEGKRGSRLPPDFGLTPEREAYARKHRLDPIAVLEAFRDHWIAAAGAKGVKLDWDAVWRTWVRNEVKFAKPNGRAAPPNNDAAWAEAKSRANALGFRVPHSAETPSSYQTAMNNHELARPRTVPLAGFAALTAKLTSGISK